MATNAEAVAGILLRVFLAEIAQCSFGLSFVLSKEIIIVCAKFLLGISAGESMVIIKPQGVVLADHINNISPLTAYLGLCIFVYKIESALSLIERTEREDDCDYSHSSKYRRPGPPVISRQWRWGWGWGAWSGVEGNDSQMTTTRSATIAKTILATSVYEKVK